MNLAYNSIIERMEFVNLMAQDTDGIDLPAHGISVSVEVRNWGFYVGVAIRRKPSLTSTPSAQLSDG